MRGIGSQDALARAALRFQKRPHQQYAREFTMQRRAAGCSVIASSHGNFQQRFFETRRDFHHALHDNDSG